MLFCFCWGIFFYILGFSLSKFELFSLGLLPTAIYEFFRTEGKKNTKPLSFLFSAILVLQFLHITKIYPFPFDISFITSLLPVTLPETTDSVIFLSVIVLLLISSLLIRYTWGSVTKFLAIILLAGSLIQGYLFWPEIQSMLNSPEGKTIMEEQKEKIKDNLYYRLRRELRY